MNDLYYSQRQNRLQIPAQPEIGSAFWVAFRTYVDRLSDDNWFSGAFPESYGCGPLGRNDDDVRKRLCEEIGQIDWPIPANANPIPDTERVLDLVEFFHAYAQKPTNRSCAYCVPVHTHPDKYDSRQGQHEFTCRVNQMFRRFNHPYHLTDGRVERVGSEVLDARIASVDLQCDDSHLVTLLNSAVSNFFDRSGTKRLEGLQSIVNAFERLKTLEGGDKQESVARVIAKLSPAESIQTLLDERLRNMTRLANQYTIRHHEGDKIPLTDDALIEYLFYDYFNLVRLILQKYGKLKG